MKMLCDHQEHSFQLYWQILQNDASPVLYYVIIMFCVDLNSSEYEHYFLFVQE